jgi:hypothetical protein
MHKNDYAYPDANSILAFLLHLQYMEQIPFITPKETNAANSARSKLVGFFGTKSVTVCGVRCLALLCDLLACAGFYPLPFSQ